MGRTTDRRRHAFPYVLCQQWYFFRFARQILDGFRWNLAEVIVTTNRSNDCGFWRKCNTVNQFPLTPPLSPVHTGDKVEFNTVDFVESRLLPIRQLCCWYDRLCCQCVRPKQHGRLCRLSRKSTVLNSTLSPVCTGLKGAFTRTLHEWFHWNASSCWLSHRTDRSATAVYGNGRIRIFFNGQATANRFDRYCPLQTTLH